MSTSPPFLLVAHGDIFEHPRTAFPLAMRSLYRRSAVRSYRAARHVVTVSRALRERAIRCGATPERVSVIPNGIAAEEIDGENSPMCQRQAEVELLYVGRLAAEKAVDVAIRALAQLSLPSVRLRIVGDGPIRGTLEGLAEKLNVSHRVQFLGSQPRRSLRSYYASSDVVLLPSLSEAQPVVTLEAQVCGKPVIASRVGGIPDVVSQGNNGLLVAPGDVSAFADAIRTLCADPALRAAMSARAREVAKQFAWPELLKQFHRTVRSAFGDSAVRSSTARSSS